MTVQAHAPSIILQIWRDLLCQPRVVHPSHVEKAAMDRAAWSLRQVVWRGTFNNQIVAETDLRATRHMLLSLRLFGVCIYDTKTWHSIVRLVPTWEGSPDAMLF